MVCCFHLTPSYAEGPDTPLSVYVASAYDNISSLYKEMKCREQSCSSEAFRSKLKLKARDAGPQIDKLWKSYAHLGLEAQVQSWLNLVIKSIDHQLSSQSGSLSDATIVWLILDRSISDLELSKGHAAHIKLMVELQLRAFRAIQLQQVFEISEQFAAVPLTSIDVVRIRAMEARMYRFFGEPQRAYKRSLEIIASAVFENPEIIFSKLYKDERHWVWSNAYLSAKAMDKPLTAKTVDIVFKQESFGENGAQIDRESNLNRLQNLDSKLVDELYLVDNFTRPLWKALKIKSSRKDKE